MEDLKRIMSSPEKLESLLSATGHNERFDILDNLREANQRADISHPINELTILELETLRKACLAFIAEQGFTLAEIQEYPWQDDGEDDDEPDDVDTISTPAQFVWRNASGGLTFWTGQHEVPPALEALLTLGYKLDDFRIRGAALEPRNS